MEILITLTNVISGNYQPRTGLTGANIKFYYAPAGNIEKTVSVTEKGNGTYLVSGFADDDAEYLLLKVDGSEQQAFGHQWIGGIPSLHYMDGIGENIQNGLNSRLKLDGTNTPTNHINWGGFRLNSVGDPASGIDVGDRDYNDARYVDRISNQGVSGQKTFSNIIVDVGTSDINNPKFQIMQASNPPNGGAVGLKAGFQSDNKMLFDWLSSKVQGIGEWFLTNLKIPTSASKYIVGNPAQNDYVWRKWVQDNFVAISGGGGGWNLERSRWVLVDSTFTEEDEESGYCFRSIAVAIEQIATVYSIIEPLSSSNIWTIYIRQHPESTYGYDGNIEVPDWINIIGEGQVLITGLLTRATSSETGITSKLENLTFNGDGDSDISRFEVNNCIFGTDTRDNNVITKSKVKNSGFFAAAVTSGGNNKIINCFGNKDVAWNGSTDKVYSYNFIEGDSY